MKNGIGIVKVTPTITKVKTPCPPRTVAASASGVALVFRVVWAGNRWGACLDYRYTKNTEVRVIRNHLHLIATCFLSIEDNHKYIVQPYL